jgi:hypothetical protein
VSQKPTETEMLVAGLLATTALGVGLVYIIFTLIG